MKRILGAAVVAAVLLASACAQLGDTAKGLGQALLTTPGQLDAMDREKYVYRGPAGESPAPRNNHRIALAPVVFLNPAALAIGGGYANRVPEALDETLHQLLDHRGFEVVRSGSLGRMTYPEKRDSLVRLQMVLAGAVRDDRSRRVMYVDDPSVILELTEPLSGEIVVRRTLSVASMPVEVRYVVGDGINEGIALKEAYRKYYLAIVQTLERELTSAAILAAEPDARALKKKKG